MSKFLINAIDPVKAAVLLKGWTDMENEGLLDRNNNLESNCSLHDSLTAHCTYQRYADTEFLLDLFIQLNVIKKQKGEINCIQCTTGKQIPKILKVWDNLISKK